MFIDFYIEACIFISECGGRLVAGRKAQELFSHSNYGDHNYDNKEDCEWIITAVNQRVRFTFTAFEVEDETDCR